jgi:hypothetical protein
MNAVTPGFFATPEPESSTIKARMLMAMPVRSERNSNGKEWRLGRRANWFKLYEPQLLTATIELSEPRPCVCQTNPSPRRKQRILFETSVRIEHLQLHTPVVLKCSD